jgi:spore germination cell wall hydrolase CwlJ-like protein
MSDPKSKISQTIYNEARGEGNEGMKAVASTIKNRYDMNRSYLGGQNYTNICTSGYEGGKGSEPDPSKMATADKKAWEYSQNLADQIISGEFTDTTGGATHFDKSADSFNNLPNPEKMNYMFQLGNHHFFQEQ